MYKIYCTVITPRIQALAKSLGVSDSFANNLVSTWQSSKNMPGVEPTIDELRDFMKANKDAMRLVQLAMPVYDTMSDLNFGPGAMVNPDTSITLNMFEVGTPFSTLEKMIEGISHLNKHKDLITDFKSFYALELYAAKLRVNRGGLNEPTSEEDYDYAAKLLKQAKKEFPNEFPEPQVVQPTVTQQQETNIITTVLGSDMIKSEEAPQEVKEDAPAYTADPLARPMIGIDRLNVDTNNPRARVNRDFTPAERRDRVENIARRFSSIVDEMVEELITAKQESIAEASSVEEQEAIRQEIRNLTHPVNGRRTAIEELTFNGIYERIKEEFVELSETSEEEFDEDFGEGNGHIIKDKYQRIVNNFDALFEEACSIISASENLKITLKKFAYNNGKSTEKRIGASIDQLNAEEIEDAEFGDDEDGSRTTGNEGWSFKVRFVDPYSSLSADVKRALHDIKKVRPDGEIDLDDLGEIRYISTSYAHATLLDKLSEMIDADDFSKTDKEGNLIFPALEEIAKRIPWVSQVINKLEADPRLASLFFADFRKDFISYWKQKMDEETGTMSTMPLNQPTALDSTLESVISNYEQGVLADEESIFDNSQKVNISNAEKGITLVDDILLDIQEVEDAADIDDLANKISKGLRMLGFTTTTPTSLKAILSTELGIVSLENVARAMGEIFEAAQSIDDNAHLISELHEPYKKIASIVGEVSELNAVQSFREGDKTHYSYSAPNYVDTMFKLFKNDNRRQGYIDNRFKPYDWFFDKRTNEWNNEWLNLLENDTDVQEKLAIKELNSIDSMTSKGVSPTYYTNWKPSQIKESFVLEYFSVGENKGSKKQFAWYNFPIFSDSPVVKFIKFLRYTSDKEGTFKEKLRPLLRKVVMQELGRIRLVEDRAKVGASSIQNFDKVGGRFHFFPELNLAEINGVSFLETIRELAKSSDIESINKLIDDQVEIIMNDNFNKFISEHNPVDSEGNHKLVNRLIKQGVAASPKGAMEKLEEYFWNQCFATSQIIQLTTTDLAYYKNGVDFQKRYKEVYAAGTKLNTNSKYGRKLERTIYLADNIITSANYLDIKKNLMQAMKEGRLSRMDVDSILYKFKDINVADAQAYRTISSYRSVLDMMGLWTDDMEATLTRFEHGEWDISDFNIVWQTIKPFVFTQIDKPNGVGGRMLVPHQNKNSEFLLLSTYSMIANRIGKSPKLRALNAFMENNNIDVSQFESSVKAGGQGVIDINVSHNKVMDVLTKGSVTVNGKEYLLEAKDFKGIKKHFDNLLDNDELTQEEYNSVMDYFEPTEEEVLKMLEKATKDESGNFKEDVVHEIPYSDYVVQQPTPEHLFDTEAVFGSQFRNLIISDMPEDMEITVNGMTVKGRDNIVNLYQSLIVENLLEDYQKLTKKFTTIEDFQKAMIETIEGNPKYGRDMLDALSIVEHVINGEKVKMFNIPLHNPSTTTKIQELVNSMFKNAITKQRIHGGNAILVSNFGFTNKLHILRNNDGSIQGAECYLPFYTKDYFEPFLVDVVDKNGKVIGQEVDIKAIRKQDPELLKMIGYRIPTEGKYSMLPLIIKGFLPQQNGSAIMLPADVTQIAGSDFDVDKLFLMIPEFKLFTHDVRRAMRDYKAITNDNAVKTLIDSIFKTQGVSDEMLDTTEIESSAWKEWWNEHKDEYKYETPIIRKIRYNNNKPVQNNNKEQRNNMIIDIAFAILTNKDTAEKINNPGSFDKAKLAARIATITNDADLLDSYMKKHNIKSLKDVVQSLLKADLDTLNDILKGQKERNPLSVDTFIYNHKQNMTGGALIGMYANNTTMQAKFQRTRLAIKSENSFTINGREIKSVHDIYSQIGDIQELISKNCAEFSAASVDNVKDPVLADLLQNTETANIAGFMLRAGMSIQEVGLLFTQPIVRECIEDTGSVLELNRYIQKYAKMLEDNGGHAPDLILREDNFTSEGLLSNIVLFNAANWVGKEVAEGSDVPLKLVEQIEDTEINDILSDNILSAQLFQHISDLSEIISELTRISRGDSPNGSIDRSIARAKNQVHRVNKFIRESKDNKFPFVGIEGIMRSDFITPEMTLDDMRTKLNSAPMAMLQSFYSLGIDFGLKLDSRYFTQLNPYIDSLVDLLYQNSPFDTISDEMLEKFYSELTTFGLSMTSIFGNDENSTFDQKRNYYLYQFPKDFMDIISNPDNAGFSSLSAIRKLSVKEGEIIMKRSGRLTPDMREILMRGFDSLLYISDESRKLALDLFMYSYYNDGFNFGPNSFGNFFSTHFLNSVPEVVNFLRNMNFNIGSESYFSRFLEQFYANHYTEGILPVYDTNPFSSRSAEGVTEAGQLVIKRRNATNHNVLGSKVYNLVVFNNKLYEVDPNQIGEKYVIYNPINTHSDPQGVKYNANMTVEEMAEVKVDKERVEASKSMSSTTESGSFNLDSLDFDSLFADKEGEYSFEDGLSSLEETPCNL